MKLLIVCATKPEINFVTLGDGTFFQNAISGKHTVDILFTGVGMMATAFSLTDILHTNSYDLVINAGIAGSFTKAISKGEVVMVEEEVCGDLGAEDDEYYLDVFELNLADKNDFPFIEGAIRSENKTDSALLDSIKKVRGLTVNKVHGNEKSIEKIKTKYSADIETMEGAACFYVCKQKNIACIQLRSISNYVEKRNRAEWDIASAVKNLNTFLKSFIDELPA